MSFRTMHDDYLDPDKHLWPDEEPEILEVPFEGSYAAKWALSDFYEEDEELLRSIWMTEGQSFVADWGCKKEINYCHVERVNGRTTIIAKAFIDELPEIADTCLWRAFGGNDKCDSGWDALAKIHGLDCDKDHDRLISLFEDLEDYLRESHFEEHEAERLLESEATWEDFIDAIDEAESTAMRKAEECYQDLVEMTKRFLTDEWGVKLEK